MARRRDLTGQQFGRLTVLRELCSSPGKRCVAWECQCNCGRVVVVPSKALLRGSRRSCGCLQDEARRSAAQKKIANGNGYKHGGVANGHKTRLYRIWSGMRARCDNPNLKCYPNYGGRGIAVCDEWQHSFAAFRDWALANGYSDDLSIDRIDNDKNYSPDNCRWATKSEQQRNRRPYKWHRNRKS